MTYKVVKLIDNGDNYNYRTIVESVDLQFGVELLRTAFELAPDEYYTLLANPLGASDIADYYYDVEMRKRMNEKSYV